MEPEKPLTKEIAKDFIANPKTVGLESFNSIEDEAAAILAGWEGEDLNLNSLRRLSDFAASALSGFRGTLRLDDRTVESVLSAEARSRLEHTVKHPGRTILNLESGASYAAAMRRSERELEDMNAADANARAKFRASELFAKYRDKPKAIIPWEEYHLLMEEAYRW